MTGRVGRGWVRWGGLRFGTAGPASYGKVSWNMVWRGRSGWVSPGELRYGVVRQVRHGQLGSG